MDNRILFAIFCMLGNGFGLPNFIQKDKNGGLTKLLRSVVTLGIIGVINSIHGILLGIDILKMSNEDYAAMKDTLGVDKGVELPDFLKDVFKSLSKDASEEEPFVAKKKEEAVTVVDATTETVEETAIVEETAVETVEETTETEETVEDTAEECDCECTCGKKAKKQRDPAKKSALQKLFSLIASLLFIVSAAALSLFVAIPFAQEVINFFALMCNAGALGVAYNNVSVAEIVAIITSTLGRIIKLVIVNLPYMILAAACVLSAIITLTKKKGALQIVCSALFFVAAFFLPLTCLARPTLLVTNIVLVAATALALFLSIASVCNSNALNVVAKIVSFVFLGFLALFVAAAGIYLSINVVRYFISYIASFSVVIIPQFRSFHYEPALAIVFIVLYSIFYIFSLNVGLLSLPIFGVYAVTMAAALAFRQFSSSDYKIVKKEKVEEIEEATEETVEETIEEVEEVAVTEEQTDAE